MDQFLDQSQDRTQNNKMLKVQDVNLLNFGYLTILKYNCLKLLLKVKNKLIYILILIFYIYKFVHFVCIR